MSNGKISLRQMKRLLFFDVIGVGLVALPDLLAETSGTAGVLALFAGAAIFIVYLLLLRGVMKKETGKYRWIYGIYGVYLLLVSGYGLFLLADLIKRFLLPEQSYSLIAIMILLLLWYSISGGPEGRARTYEILFWPLVLLLIILLGLGVRGAEPENLLPVICAYPQFGKGVYLSFLLCSVGQMVFFLPRYTSEEVSEKELCKGAAITILWAILFLAVIYEMLLGSFGRVALSNARTPIMIYTSNIVMPGGFLRRQEALIAGVCFIGLLAFIGGGFHYGTLCLKELKESKWMTVVSLVFILFVSCVEHINSGKNGGVGTLLFWVTPVALLLPFLLSVGNRAKKPVALMLACSIVFLTTGCSVQELEDRSFPMVMSLSKKDGACTLRYKYMDLSLVSDKEKAKQSGDGLSVTASTVASAIYEMDKQNGKMIDLNHLKILLLERSFLEDEELMQELVEKGNGGIQLPGNMLIFATDNNEEIEKLQEDMDADLGSYLEELMEGNPNYKNTGGTTFKNVICDWYNGNGNTILPKLSAKDKLPVVQGYLLMQSDALGEKYRIEEVTEEEGLVANLCDGEANALDITIDNGRIHMENVDVSYEYSQSNRYLLCNVKISGDIVKSESSIIDEEKAKKEADNFFCGEIQNVWKKNDIDLTNSFYHLRCHDPNLCQAYMDNYKKYHKNMKLEVSTNFNFVE